MLTITARFVAWHCVAGFAWAVEVTSIFHLIVWILNTFPGSVVISVSACYITVVNPATPDTVV